MTHRLGDTPKVATTGTWSADPASARSSPSCISVGCFTPGMAGGGALGLRPSQRRAALRGVLSHGHAQRRSVGPASGPPWVGSEDSLRPRDRQKVRSSRNVYLSLDHLESWLNSRLIPTHG